MTVFPGGRNASSWLMLPAFLLMGFLVLGGLLLMLHSSLSQPFSATGLLTLEHYKHVLSQPNFWQSTYYSLYLAITASFFSTVLGVITAYFLSTTAAPGLRSFCQKVMQLGLIIPYLYVIFLAFIFLGQAGLLSRLLISMGLLADKQLFPPLLFDPAGVGILWVYTFKGIPFVTLMVMQVMVRINRQYRDVSQTLGAGEFQQLFRIYLPLSRPIILWCTLILFAYALGSFEVPHLMSAFEPRPQAAVLYSLYLRPSLASLSEAMALGILLLLLGFITAMLYLGLMNRWLGGRRG